ncbi:hypothetical protein M8J75_013163 [Diaphorina citri]|nr:hypothetical protein M8J75_013163 [Diaphorina citri]
MKNSQNLNVLVESPNVKYTERAIEAVYEYARNTVVRENDRYVCKPTSSVLNIRTQRKVSKVGVMLIGWGGNNGSTVTGAILANKHNLCWQSKDGLKKPNWYGSITQSSTVRLGMDSSGKDVYVPMNSLLPMVDPDDIVLDGWDISSVNLADAMERSKVLDFNLQIQLRPYMEHMKPRPSIYFPEFIAANQAGRADNVLSGTKQEVLDQVRRDIRDFKQKNSLDQVIVLWTANTERFSDIVQGLNDTAENLLESIQKNAAEVSPSTIFAVASILEGCTYINGAPQNTFVPGAIDLAEKKKVFIAGDDFKSGQTKVKSVLVDFLVTAGIKPVSIISKSNVVDDMVASNSILYRPGEKPDHTVVIKYVPYVGDSKRALDEYTSEILLGGHNTISMHNTCEDSLLASPLILDLIILAELSSRIQFTSPTVAEYTYFHPVLSILSYLCKAPLVPPGTPVVNALAQQRSCIENILRACLSLPPENSMTLEHKLPRRLFQDKSKSIDSHPQGDKMVSNNHDIIG